jgi:hypothetical protein
MDFFCPPSLFDENFEKKVGYRCTRPWLLTCTYTCLSYEIIIKHQQNISLVIGILVMSYTFQPLIFLLGLGKGSLENSKMIEKRGDFLDSLPQPKITLNGKHKDPRW